MLKLTDKEERFAQLVVELGNQSEAYREAYDVTDPEADWIPSKASHLVKKDNIRTRIEQIRKEIEIAHKITRERLVEEYLDIIRCHKECRDYFKGNKIKGDDLKKIYALSNSGFIKGSDVTAAINGIARLMGFDKEPKSKIADNVNIQINIKRDRE